jgi:hypothetical protein
LAPKRGSEPKRGQKVGGKLDFDPQLRIYINHRFLTVQGGSEQQNVEDFVKLKPFLCREAIEEANFGGHFRELRSTFFSVVSCVGFLRSRRTQPD